MNQFDKISDYIDRLLQRYLHARSALEIFEALRKLRSPAHSGRKKVHSNVRILSRYKYFFVSAEDVYNRHMMLELTKLFDTHPKALSLQNVTRIIDRHFDSLGPADFFTFRKEKGDPVPEHLKSNYMPLTRADLAGLKKSFKSIEKIVEKLKNHRDTRWAHDDMEIREMPNITGIEVHRAFEVAKKTFDKLSAKLNWTSTMRDEYLRSSRTDTKRIIHDLLQAEKQALGKIPTR